MVYKGERLDLMTTYGGGAPAPVLRDPPGGWLTRALEPAAETPSFWVDDPVLRCCNQAYGLAIAHRAYEVGLGHLVHALTLDVEAIDVLRAYNVNVTTLRHESAAIMADELSMPYGAESYAPANSEEFVMVLRFAADRAYARRSPISTDDIVDTLFDMKSDHTSRSLLSRHRADWRLRTRPDLQAEEPPRPRTSVPTPTDSFQNTRIDALERAVHELSADLAHNRQTFVELIDELRGGRVEHETGGTNGTGPNPGLIEAGETTAEEGALIDRLYAMERSVETKFDELARAWDVLGKRIDQLEDAVEATPAPESAGLTAQALTDISNKTAEAVGDKLAGADLSALSGKIAQLDGALATLPERLSALERRLTQGNGPAAANMAALVERLTSLEDLIGKGGDASIETAPLLAALSKIEGRVADTGLIAEGLAERLDGIDVAIEGPGVGDARIKAFIDEAVQGVGDTFDHQRDEIARAVVNAVAARLGALSSQVEERQQEQTQQMTAHAERITALDGKTTNDTERVLGAVAGIDQNSAATHDALIKLNTNQQTLANSFEQLRTDWKAEIGALEQRMKDGSVGSVGGMSTLHAKVDHLQQLLAARQPFWTRFRIWLYGTDDWYAASWGKRGNVEA